jgi:hypothetical protein
VLTTEEQDHAKELVKRYRLMSDGSYYSRADVVQLNSWIAEMLEKYGAMVISEIKVIQLGLS